MTTPYASPPVGTSECGESRHVGVEVELAGLDVSALAQCVAESLGGQTASDSVCETSATVDTPFGPFRVELDSAPLKERTYLQPLQKLGLDDPELLQEVEHSVVSFASEFVPAEIITPPIPWNRLHELDPLWALVRERGGMGTRAAVRYSFGLHLNPELPAPMTAQTLVTHMQAFFLLEDWLMRKEGVDWSRRVGPFIDRFPEAYRRACLQPDYQPDIDTFVEDYLEFSPTRNRILDLLPLFEHLRPGCLEGREVDGANLVKARPTFHYRLPNSEVDEPGWSPARSWSNWVEVERLAADDERRSQMAADYREMADLPFRLQRFRWMDEVEAKWM